MWLGCGTPAAAATRAGLAGPGEAALPVRCRGEPCSHMSGQARGLMQCRQLTRQHGSPSL